MSATLTDTSKSLTLEEFLSLPDGDITYELKDGQAIAKPAPFMNHSRLQAITCFLLDTWGNAENCPLPGDGYLSWVMSCKLNGKDWCPVPDVTFMSRAKLATLDLDQGVCAVPPELVVEVLSPDESFDEMTQKALDYLAVGVQRVWIVSDRQKSLTVFALDSAPVSYFEDQPMTDNLFPGLTFSIDELFAKAKI